MCIYIYIYIERERDVCVYMYIYTHIRYDIDVLQLLYIIISLISASRPRLDVITHDKHYDMYYVCDYTYYILQWYYIQLSITYIYIYMFIICMKVYIYSIIKRLHCVSVDIATRWEGAE